MAEFQENPLSIFLLLRVANFCILLGLILSVAFTITVSRTGHRTDNFTIVTGYGLSLFLIGLGFCVLRVFKPCLKVSENDKILLLDFGSTFSIGMPYVRQRNEISKIVKETRIWFYTLGLSFVTPSCIMIRADVLIRRLHLDRFDAIVETRLGLFVGLSSLFIVTGLFCVLIAARGGGRIKLTFTLMLVFLSLIGSLVLTSIAQRIGTLAGTMIEHGLLNETLAEETKDRLYLDSEGRIYYPYWQIIFAWVQIIAKFYMKLCHISITVHESKISLWQLNTAP